jgi:hypothetical protein
MRTCIVDTVNDTFETLCLGCCGLYPILSIPSLLEINVVSVNNIFDLFFIVLFFLLIYLLTVL